VGAFAPRPQPRPGGPEGPKRAMGLRTAKPATIRWSKVQSGPQVHSEIMVTKKSNDPNGLRGAFLPIEAPHF
jgi:hypothetical protein